MIDKQTKEVRESLDILIKAVISILIVYYIYCTYISVRAFLNKRLRKRLRAACLLRIVSAALVLVSVCFFAVLHFTEEQTTYSYNNGIINEHSSYGKFDVLFFIMFTMAVLLVLASIPLDSAAPIKGSSKARNIVVSVVLAFATGVIGMVLIISNYKGDLSDHDPKYYRYDSPDKKHSIVIRERSYMFSGYGDIYQVKNQKAEKIGSFTTENGLRNEGKYKLEWSKDKVKITYLYSGEQHRTETADLKEL